MRSESVQRIAATPLDSRFESSHYRLARERFLEKRDDAEFGASLRRIRIRVPGHQNEFWGGPLPPQRAARLKSIHSGQYDIKEHDVRKVHSGSVDRLPSGACRDDGAALLFEPHREQSGHLRRIVDDEHSDLFALRVGRGCHRREDRRPHTITLAAFEERPGVFVSGWFSATAATGAPNVHKNDGGRLAPAAKRDAVRSNGLG